MRMYKFNFAHSKMTINRLTGVRAKDVDYDKERFSRLLFIEFIVFLCFLADEIFIEEKLLRDLERLEQVVEIMLE